MAFLGFRHSFSLLVMKSKLFKALLCACVWFRVAQPRSGKSENWNVTLWGVLAMITACILRLHSPHAFCSWCFTPDAALCRCADWASAARLSLTAGCHTWSSFISSSLGLDLHHAPPQYAKIHNIIFLMHGLSLEYRIKTGIMHICFLGHVKDQSPISAQESSC